MLPDEREETPVGEPRLIYDGDGITLTAELIVYKNPKTIRYGELNKQATAAKRARDMPRAVELLQEAKALYGDDYEDTRLAKFLQQAGRFDDAMTEIQWLIDTLHGRIERHLSHQPRVTRRASQAGYMSRIHRDAVMICKRAKETELQSHHGAEQLRWTNLAHKLWPLSEACDLQRSEEFALACAASRQGDRTSMEAYFRKWRPDVSE
tara:strand:- start:1785 stop:2408 length:624 start_codon:yes stop_codon:yes gene_type:complete